MAISSQIHVYSNKAHHIFILTHSRSSGKSPSKRGPAGSVCREGMKLKYEQHSCNLRRNTTYGLCVAKRPSPPWAFALLISEPTIVLLIVSCSTFPYFFFLPNFLQLPVLPKCFVQHFPFQNPLEHARSRSSSSVLFHIPLPFTPMYFLLLIHFLFLYFPSFTYFPSSWAWLCKLLF